MPSVSLQSIYQNVNASKQNKLNGLINIKNELWYLAYFSVSIWIHQSRPKWMELRLLIKKATSKRTIVTSSVVIFNKWVKMSWYDTSMLLQLYNLLVSMSPNPDVNSHCATVLPEQVGVFLIGCTAVSQQTQTESQQWACAQEHTQGKRVTARENRKDTCSRHRCIYRGELRNTVVEKKGGDWHWHRMKLCQSSFSSSTAEHSRRRVTTQETTQTREVNNGVRNLGKPTIWLRLLVLLN